MARFSCLLWWVLVPAAAWAQPAGKPDPLAKKIKLEFAETSLGDVLEFFRAQSSIPIIEDPQSFEGLGAAGERKITLSASGVSLAAALDMVLEPLQLTTIRRDEVLLITSRQEAADYQVRKVYPVKDLLAGESPLASNARDLADVIQQAVAPASWENNGGTGTIRPLADVLVVAQGQAAHADLARLLATLRKVYAGKPPDDPYTAIRKALDEKTQIEFVETPLTDVIKYLSDKHKVPIVLDPDVDGTATLSAKLGDVSLRSMLSLLLSPGLTFELRYEVLWITRKDWAAQHLESRVYDVRDLLTDDGSDEPLNASDLLSTITGTVAPDSWSDRGGRGTARTLGGLLVVYQTQATHYDIQQLLAQLRQKLKQPR